VYVFVRSTSSWTADGGSWELEAYIKAPNAGSDLGLTSAFGGGDSFGWSIGLTDAVLAVGASYEGSCENKVSSFATLDKYGCPRSGAVYLFTRSGTWWRFRAYLKAENAARGDMFGDSLALSESALVIGSPRESSCARGVMADTSTANEACAYAGAIYAFQLPPPPPPPPPSTASASSTATMSTLPPSPLTLGKTGATTPP